MKLITERENLILGLTAPVQKVNRLHFECAEQLPGSDQSAVMAVFAKFKSISHPHQSAEILETDISFTSAPHYN